MSVWEWRAAIGGFVKANSSEDEAQVLTPSEVQNLASFIDEPPVWH
jgi:hypothetical protein